MIRKYFTKSFSKYKASNTFLLTYKLAFKRKAQEMKAVRKSRHSSHKAGRGWKSNREDFLTADEDSRLTGTDVQTDTASIRTIRNKAKRDRLLPCSGTSDFLLLTTKQRDWYLLWTLNTFLSRHPVVQVSGLASVPTKWTLNSHLCITNAWSHYSHKSKLRL